MEKESTIVTHAPQQSNNSVLAPLVVLDELERVDGLPTPSFIHRDHRWTLPLIRWAQDAGHLPSPTKLFLFDAHHDSLPPRNASWIGQPYDVSVSGITELCRHKLSSLDDDWITAGMELGLISDAVVFGVHDTYSAEEYSRFTDSCGNDHRILFVGLPGGELKYQGALSDVAKRNSLQALWDVLEWDPGRQDIDKFASGRERFLLDFDLDCFAVDWNDYTFPWPDEVWEREFRTPSEYRTTMHLTGADWTSSLMNAAGMVTFCREPDCCGGNEKADENWANLNRYLFNNRLERVAI